MSDIKFNIYSGVLKAYDAGDGIKRLRTTASSTIRDLSGDTMTLKALQKMAATAKQNMTIFLNHKYQVPEDVLGSVDGVELKAHGSEVWDLDFDIRVEESNPRAVKTHEAIVNGTLLGTSIGALIPQGGASKSDDGLLIDDVILLEASIVGIPANPRSFVHYAVKAYEKAEEEDEEAAVEAAEARVKTADGRLLSKGLSAQIISESGLPPTEDAAYDTKAKVWITVDTEDTAEADAAAGSAKPKGSKPKGDSKAKDSGFVGLGEAGPEVVAKLGEAIQDSIHVASQGTPAAAGDGDTTTETDETAGSPAEGEATDGDEAAEEQPGNTDVPATQEAPDESSPESDGDEDETAKMVGKSFEALSKLLEGTTADLIEARKSLAAETEKRATAERKLAEAKESLKLASQFVERISALPIGRRAGFSSEVTGFRTKFADLFGEEAVKILEK